MLPLLITNNSLLWLLLFVFVLLCIIIFVNYKNRKSNDKNTGKNKTSYIVLGIIMLFLLTPLLAYLFTLNVNLLEGGRGFAIIYSIPFIFLGLLILWLILHKLFHRKNSFYKISTKFLSITSLVLTLFYIGSIINEKQQQKDLKRNRYACRQKVKESYKGVVVDTSRGNIKIRKIDTTYQEFKYMFNDRDVVKTYFFIGQEVKKNTDEEKFSITLRNGEIKKFTIPCYQ